MTGVVTSYNSSTGELIIDATFYTGSGTYSDWKVSLNGAPGPQGSSGYSGYSGLGVSGYSGASFDPTMLNDTEEPTGFLHPENIVSTYDKTLRTITLTASSIVMYWHGTKVWNGVTSWTSSAHPDTNGSWFLYYNGTDFIWSTTPWNFNIVQIAYVYYGTTTKFGLRECHGVMQWQCHEEFHQTIGTYRTLGGALNGYTIPPTVDNHNRPGVDITTLHDEDLYSTLTTLAVQGPYTQVSLTGSNSTSNITTGNLNIVPLVGGIASYNYWNGTTWSQVALPQNNWMNIWLIAMPTTNDADSQVYRYLWLQGQNVFINSLSTNALNEDPRNLNLGDLSLISPEFTIIAQITIQKTGSLTGEFEIKQVRTVFGTKMAPVAGGSNAQCCIVLNNTITWSSVPPIRIIYDTDNFGKIQVFIDSEWHTFLEGSYL